MATQNLAVQQIAVSLIQHSPTNPATRVAREIEALAESIKAHGLYQPLSAVKAGKKYTLTDGHRRLEAAKLAGLEAVPVIVGKVDSPVMAQLVTGTMQERLTPWETAQLIAALFKAKYKGVQIAQSVGRSEGWVSKFKTINEAAKKAPDAAESFGGYTAVDDLYKAALLILNPPADDGEEETEAGEQLDLIDQENEAKMAMIAARFAELFALPADSAQAVDGKGEQIHVTLSFSSKDAAVKALSASWLDKTD